MPFAQETLEGAARRIGAFWAKNSFGLVSVPGRGGIIHHRTSHRGNVGNRCTTHQQHRLDRKAVVGTCKGKRCVVTAQVTGVLTALTGLVLTILLVALPNYP